MTYVQPFGGGMTFVPATTAMTGPGNPAHTTFAPPTRGSVDVGNAAGTYFGGVRHGGPTMSDSNVSTTYDGSAMGEGNFRGYIGTLKEHGSILQNVPATIDMIGVTHKFDITPAPLSQSWIVGQPMFLLQGHMDERDVPMSERMYPSVTTLGGKPSLILSAPQLAQLLQRAGDALKCAIDTEKATAPRGITCPGSKLTETTKATSKTLKGLASGSSVPESKSKLDPKFNFDASNVDKAISLLKDLQSKLKPDNPARDILDPAVYSLQLAKLALYEGSNKTSAADLIGRYLNNQLEPVVLRFISDTNSLGEYVKMLNLNTSMLDRLADPIAFFVGEISNLLPASITAKQPNIEVASRTDVEPETPLEKVIKLPEQLWPLMPTWKSAVEKYPIIQWTRVDHVRENVKFLGFLQTCHLEESRITLDIAAVGWCRTFDYWGPSPKSKNKDRLRVTDNVGFVVRRPDAKSSLTLVPWRDFSKLYPDEEELVSSDGDRKIPGAFFPVGTITQLDTDGPVRDVNGRIESRANLLLGYEHGDGGVEVPQFKDIFDATRATAGTQKSIAVYVESWKSYVAFENAKLLGGGKASADALVATMSTKPSSSIESKKTSDFDMEDSSSDEDS